MGKKLRVAKFSASTDPSVFKGYDDAALLINKNGGIYIGDETSSPQLIADLSKIPNNEIWYTSNDSNIVTLADSSIFGANIVSNTYENGKGVIKFDGDVTSIGNWTFADNWSLTSITIPNSVTEIGEAVFYGCTTLTSITIPDSVTLIGKQAFLSCLSLKSVTIPDSVTEIGEYAFSSCSSLKSVAIPESVTLIGNGAFRGCSSLKSVTIPESVTEIGEYAFFECYSLASITIPESVTKIGEGAFAGCESLKSVTIPDSIGTIRDSAFYGCSSLTSVTIPKGVAYIVNQTFSNCTSLTSIYCRPTTPPNMNGAQIFGGNASNRKIYVPLESVDAYKTTHLWSQYAADIVGCVFEDEPVLVLSDADIELIISDYFQLSFTGSGSGSGSGISEALVDEANESNSPDTTE